MRLEDDAWQSYFETAFEREAFRLETRPVYRMQREDEDFRRFLADGPAGVRADPVWIRKVQRYRRSGRWIGRVHVVRRPLTDYLRYEFEFYRHSWRAGEDIRILDLTESANPGVPEHDFYLFDEARVVRMDYTADGIQLGRELLEDVDPAPYVQWKRNALEHATPLDRYWATLRD